jgi:hypothetical protein
MRGQLTQRQARSARQLIIIIKQNFPDDFQVSFFFLMMLSALGSRREGLRRQMPNLMLSSYKNSNAPLFSRAGSCRRVLWRDPHYTDFMKAGFVVALPAHLMIVVAIQPCGATLLSSRGHGASHSRSERVPKYCTRYK